MLCIIIKRNYKLIKDPQVKTIITKLKDCQQDKSEQYKIYLKRPELTV